MAIENILDNASKYTSDNGSIRIMTAEKDNQAVVSISDTGVGILPEDIPLLFEKFNRIPNTRTHKVAGSGLGLYWVEKVIQLHNGDITVDSTIGEGTMFTVAVPKGQ
jgi:signal transduction histidine kinase